MLNQWVRNWTVCYDFLCMYILIVIRRLDWIALTRLKRAHIFDFSFSCEQCESFCRIWWKCVVDFMLTKPYPDQRLRQRWFALCLEQQNAIGSWTTESQLGCVVCINQVSVQENAQACTHIRHNSKWNDNGCRDKHFTFCHSILSFILSLCHFVIHSP